MPPIMADPAVVKFIETVAAGSSAAADSVAGLVLRLAGRVGRLEQTLSQQADKIKKLERQSKSPKRASAPQARIVETGVDVYGAPVRIEERIARPRGRPRGSRDGYQRERRLLRAPEPPPQILDDDWDNLGVG
jgi:hypothetical protein